MKKHIRVGIFLLLFALFITQPAISQIVPGQLVYHQTDEAIVYNWLSYVPTNIDKNTPIFIMINADAGIFSYNYDEITIDARKLAGYRKDWAEQYGYVLLKPVIPRSYDYDRGDEIY